MWKKCVTIALTIVLSACMISFNVSAVSVSFTHIQQNKSKWSWAACDQMNAMLACPANYHDQSDIAGYVLGNYTNVYPSSITDIASGVNYGCNNYKTFAGYSSPLSSSEIFSCLSVGYLVQAELQYYDVYEEPTNIRKMVIIYEAFYNNSQPYVRYYKPATGNTNLMTLESFYNVNADGDNKYVRTVRKV